MSFEEYADIRAIGRFRVVQGMMEGKWFALSRAGVLLHATSLYPEGDCYIVGAEVPEDVFNQAYSDDNLDRFGPARYFDGASGLGSLVPVWEWETNDA